MFQSDPPISIDSLKKLYRKSKALDIHLDERNEPNTTRGAWAEVRDNLERGGSVVPKNS